MPKRKMPEAHQLKSGSWNAQVFVGLDENGKRIRESFTAPTKWEAEKLAAEYIVNGMKRKAGLTVADAVDGYIAAKQNVLAPSTRLRNSSQKQVAEHYEARCSCSQQLYDAAVYKRGCC